LLLVTLGNTLLLQEADQAAEAHLANERSLLAPLNEAQQEQLASLLRTLLIAFENREQTALRDETGTR
jgi:hypothetical protein